MRFLIFVICGFVSGIFAGMGMGGGIFLVPLLSIFFGFNQIVCQSTNVLCFLIVGIVSFCIFLKNKLIDFRVVFLVTFSAVLPVIVASMFSLKISSEVVRICYAVFVILLGIFLLLKNILTLKK